MVERDKIGGECLHSGGVPSKALIHAARRMQQIRTAAAIGFPTPWVTFTDPEVAHVGMTEEEARKRDPRTQVIRVDCTLDRFMTEREQEFTTVIRVPQGRGAQMNAAALRARGDILFFMHVDMEIETATLDAIGQWSHEKARNVYA